MPSFIGGMREVADHKRPWVRLQIDSDALRLGPALRLMRRYIPTYVIPWSEVERVEPLEDQYLAGPAVRFVLRTPVDALEGNPSRGRWPAARQPVFLCGSRERLRAVMAALPARPA